MRALFRLWRVSLAVAVLAAVQIGPGSPRGAAAAGRIDPALQALLAGAAPGARIEAIVSYGQIPAAAELRALSLTGALAAPLARLPLAGVVGTPAQLRAVAALPGVEALYANRQLRYFLRESTALVGAGAVWAEGLDGAGIGVAVVDSGVDATHADLAYGAKTVQNVKFLGLQDPGVPGLGAPWAPPPLPVLHLENQPNTDTTGGHGSHVAAIAGGSGAAAGGLYRGVAPGASLIGLGAGELIAIFDALAAFDWILANRETYNIRVVNCSWGDSGPGFDPAHPVNRATKALHDAGVTVVFAAGNAGAATDTLNPYSVAPWVIGVASGDKDGASVSFFSSRGIPGDPFFHPTLTAPGYLIVSARASTGLATTPATTPADPLTIPPEHLPFYTTASGTSMAAPHVAGAVALLLQANPILTPDVIKRVLVNTARPMPGFQEYAAGAGYLDVRAAVAEARTIRDIRRYRDPRTGRDEQVYDQTSGWAGTVGPSLPGMPAADSHELAVAPGTLSLEVAVDWSLLANDLALELYDPSGALAARADTPQAIYAYANETLHIDAPAPGRWTVKVLGTLSAPQEYRAAANAVVLVHPR